MLVENGLLTADEIAVLLHPERWSLVPEQATPVDDERHVSWLADNAHAHAHPEILVVVAGVGLHAHGDRVYACAPGTVFCFAPFDRHDAAPAPHLPDSRQLWFGLHGNRATARLLDIRDGRWRHEWGHVLAECQDAIREWRRALDAHGESEALGPVRALRLRAVTELLAAALLEGDYARAEASDRSAFGAAVVAAICEHLDETAGRGEDLASLARLAGYSKYHFARLFKKHAGMTVHDYVDACRLGRTRELLAQGATQAEVADALGFSSAQSFCRWYRRYR